MKWDERADWVATGQPGQAQNGFLPTNASLILPNNQKPTDLPHSLCGVFRLDGRLLRPKNPDDVDVPLDEKLDNYKKRKLAIERLKGLLKDETDPDKIAALQNLIATEQSALNDLTADLPASGVTQQQLDDLDKEAANEPAENRIDLKEFDGAFFDGSWFDFGEFGSTLGDEVGAIGDGFAGIYYSLPIIGNPSAANAAFASAYENGPLGQSANGPWWSYDGTRLFLGVGVAAGGAAAATMVTEVYVFGSNAIGAARGTYTYLVEVGGLKWTPGAFWSTAQSVARGLVQIRPSGGMPIVRVDFHAIVAGGRRLLHLDFNKWGIKHFPWEIFK